MIPVENAQIQRIDTKEVNTFLPWFPVKDMEEAKDFYEKRFADCKYSFAIYPDDMQNKEIAINILSNEV